MPLALGAAHGFWETVAVLVLLVLALYPLAAWLWLGVLEHREQHVGWLVEKELRRRGR